MAPRSVPGKELNGSSQDHNLAVAVKYVACCLDSGPAVGLAHRGEERAEGRDGCVVLYLLEPRVHCRALSRRNMIIEVMTSGSVHMKDGSVHLNDESVHLKHRSVRFWYTLISEV